MPLQQIETLLRTKGTTTGEHRVIGPDGSFGWQEWTNQAICDEKGNVIEFQAIGRDISDRKLTEEKLHRSEAILQEAHRVAHLGSWELDLIAQKLNWSEEMFYIMGLNPAQPEPSYEDFLKLSHPDDLNMYLQLIEQALAQGTSYEVDRRIIWPNGVIRYIECQGNVARDAQGKPIRLFGTMRDITDRKQFEQTLRSQAEQEQILRTITAHIRRSLDLDTILTTTVTEVRQFFQADRVLICRFQSDWSGVVVVESVGDPQMSVLGNKFRDPCFATRYAELYSQGRTQVIEDIETAKMTPATGNFLPHFK